MQIPTTTKGLRFALFSALLFAFVASASAQSTAFTYQGRLNDGGGAANGSYDMQFTLYGVRSNGVPLAGPLIQPAVSVSNGLFAVTVDFGNAFTGASNWLEIAVSTNAANAFTTLSPRQLLTAAPYAVTAKNVTGAVAANQISGTIPMASLPATVVTNGASNVSFTGTFNGNGSGLTSLNAANITTGTILPARLPSALLSATNLLALSVNSISFVVGPTLNAPMPSGSPMTVATADLNGDGLLDIVAANLTNNTLSVYTNNGGGGFVASAPLGGGNGPCSVISADVNNDGKADLIIGNSPGSLTVLTNNGTGIFSVASTPLVSGGGAPGYLIAVDVNVDGRLDLVTASIASFPSTMSVTTNNGTGIFPSSTMVTGIGFYSGSVTSADVNGDGRPDLISANTAPGANTLLVMTNNGNGTFTLASQPSTGDQPSSVTSTDVNGDGKPDLISANYNANTLSVLINDGTGNFVLASTLSVNKPTSVIAADVGLDKKAELIVSSGSGSVVIFTNNGTGTFGLASTISISGTISSVVAGDLNGDGRVDLIAANSANNTVTVLFNNGTYGVSLKGNGAGLTNLNVTNLAGTLSFAQLPTGIITNGATNISGTFVGNAAGLTNLNAASVSSGTLDPARIPNLDASKITTGNLSDGLLSTNVALRSGGNLFFGQQEVKGSVNSHQQVLDQQQTTLIGFVSVGDSWQSFTAGTNGFLTAVGLSAEAYSGNSNYPGTIRIYDGEGINGALLATQPVIWPPYPSGGLSSYALSNAPTVVAGHQYTIRFDPQAAIAYASQNAYPGGRCSLQSSDADFMFQTYVTVFQNDTILMVSSAGYTPKVGVGTSAPQATLHVAGDILAASIVSTNTTGTNYFAGAVLANRFAGPIDSPYLKFEEVTTGTTPGGVATNGPNNWRNFNVKRRDTYNLGSTNGAGGIILPAGTYQCCISAPGYWVSTHQIRLVTTTGTKLLYGTIAYSGSGSYANDRSQIDDQITLTNSTTLRVQHWCEIGRSPNGLGAWAGTTNNWGDTTNINIFATAEFWKIK